MNRHLPKDFWLKSWKQFADIFYDWTLKIPIFFQKNVLFTLEGRSCVQNSKAEEARYADGFAWDQELLFGQTSPFPLPLSSVKELFVKKILSILT